VCNILRGVIDGFHSRGELISAPRDRDDVANAFLTGGEGFTQQKDILSEVALFDEAVWPDGAEQFFLGEEAQWILNHVQQELKRLGWQGDSYALAVHNALLGIKIKEPEAV
jgi:hypothetical protein